MLTIEDGSIVAGATSYATIAEADAYLASRGVVDWAALPESDKERLLLLSADKLRTYPWSGGRVSADQAMDWPRAGVVAHGFPVPVDVVPLDVVNAQSLLASKAIADGAGTLFPSVDGAIKRQKVDVLEVEFAAGKEATGGAVFADVDALLAPYITKPKTCFSFQVQRA